MHILLKYFTRYIYGVFVQVHVYNIIYNSYIPGYDFKKRGEEREHFIHDESLYILRFICSKKWKTIKIMHMNKIRKFVF